MQIVTLPLADIDQIVALTEEVPEFSQPYPAEVYQKRMNGVPHIILGMKVGDQLAGCKLGYQRENDGSFYSWIGCVHPDFRRMGIAQKLADEMEAWARDQAYKSIRFKTRNRLKAMLQFAIGNGFSIIRVDPKSTLDEYRIWLGKGIIKIRRLHSRRRPFSQVLQSDLFVNFSCALGFWVLMESLNGNTLRNSLIFTRYSRIYMFFRYFSPHSMVKGRVALYASLGTIKN